MKDNHFKLSTSFTNLFSNKESASHASKFVTTIEQQAGRRSLDKGLFKLNPKLAHSLEDVPVEILKKNSKSKLESLKDQSNKDKWSIFTQKIEAKETMKDKKPIAKKCKQFTIADHLLDLNSQLNNKTNKNPVSNQSELPFDMVRPSRLEHVNRTNKQQSECKYSLFQTPLLPCFASEFRQSVEITPTSFKAVEEKQGVWKIGKLKMKGKTAKIKIGQIQFEAVRAEVSGKAGVIGEDNFYELPNWKNIWVVQPTQSLFQ